MSDAAIQVLFFANLREEVGIDRYASQADDVAGLITEIKGQLGESAWQAISAENVRIAVNQTLIEGNLALKPGDEVAFLPPVTGG